MCKWIGSKVSKSAKFSQLSLSKLSRLFFRFTTYIPRVIRASWVDRYPTAGRVEEGNRHLQHCENKGRQAKRCPNCGWFHFSNFENCCLINLEKLRLNWIPTLLYMYHPLENVGTIPVSIDSRDLLMSKNPDICIQTHLMQESNYKSMPGNALNGGQAPNLISYSYITT